MKYFLGIDPGVSGAMFFFSEDYEFINMATIPRYPVEVKDKKGRTKIEYTGTMNLEEMYNLICSCVSVLKEDDEMYICLEDVHAIYMASASSSSVFMTNFGELRGLCTAASVFLDNVHFDMLPPKEWQKIVWVHSDKVFADAKIDTKATSLRCALRLFPGQDFFESERSRKAHTGLVDAALIGEAYKRYLISQQQ